MVSGRRNQRERAASESGRRVPKMPPPNGLLTMHSIFLRFLVLVLNEMVLVLVIETNHLRRRFLSRSERGGSFSFFGGAACLCAGEISG